MCHKQSAKMKMNVSKNTQDTSRHCITVATRHGLSLIFAQPPIRACSSIMLRVINVCMYVCMYVNRVSVSGCQIYTSMPHAFSVTLCR